MNIIKRHAHEFYPIMLDKSNFHSRPELSIRAVRSQILEYHKSSHRLVFLNELMLLTRLKYDEHLKDCKKLETCQFNKYCDDVLFFLNEEVEKINISIQPSDFNLEEKKQIQEFEVEVISHLKLLSLGQEIVYEDFIQEISELKEYLYLNKRNWMQLFSGKLLEMVAGGIIEEATAKSIVDFVKTEYSNIIST
ncbi:MAG TPA: hypothetical protein VFW78_09245 [Bacteroidia bacterium]|nr:hypothetical protein [Bacteroidia bacterium]